MGRSRTTHAGSGVTEKQEQFGRLIARGMSNSEACRVVGINRRTGTRWRYGRSVRNTAGEGVQYPPVCTARPRHPRYLSLEERTTIADLCREQKTVREIAAVLARSPATISRELRRSADATGRYLPGAADRLASARVARTRHRRVSLDGELRAVVVGLLGKRGARSRSPTSCGSGSRTSLDASCARSRSIKPSTRPMSMSPGLPGGVDAAADHECRDWNVVAG